MRLWVFTVVSLLAACVDSTNDKMALAMAAASGDEAMVKKYLHRVESPNFVSLKGETALGNAAANGHLEVVRIMLEAGADPRFVDAAGRTPVEYAERAGHAAVYEVLVNSKPMAD